MKKESFIIAGYRTWAKKLYSQSKLKYPQFSWYLAETPEELQDLFVISSNKVVILAGWSWILPKEMVTKKLVIGFHPSDLPDYAGGSPIQNQVLDGITKTKMSLFKLDEKIDHGEILYKQELDISGGTSEIFSNMTKSSSLILESFLKDYPDICLEPQKGVGIKCRRLKPTDSRIDLKNPPKTAKDWYDFIRCREEPYPNAYLEDQTGTLYFEKVSFRKG